MSPKSQKAGPIGMKFFVDTLGWPAGCFRLKKIQFFFKIFFSHGQRRALQLVDTKTEQKVKSRIHLTCLIAYNFLPISKCSHLLPFPQ